MTDIYVNKGVSADGVTYPRPEWWPEKVPPMNVLVGGYESLLVREVWIDDVYRLTEAKVRDQIVVDLGANVGVFTLAALALGARSVEAYEPNPSNYERLIQNLRLNPELHDRVFARAQAVHGEAGTVKLDGEWGACRVSDRGVEVQAVTLDRIASDYGEIGFLKVDVEGSEFAIFEAADLSTMVRFKHIAMELHDATPEAWRKLIQKLAITHVVEHIGVPATGGSLWARRRG